MHTLHTLHGGSIFCLAINSNSTILQHDVAMRKGFDFAALPSSRDLLRPVDRPTPAPFGLVDVVGTEVKGA
jgi:hypothetical protein